MVFVEEVSWDDPIEPDPPRHLLYESSQVFSCGKVPHELDWRVDDRTAYGNPEYYITCPACLRAWKWRIE